MFMKMGLLPFSNQSKFVSNYFRFQIFKKSVDIEGDMRRRVYWFWAHVVDKIQIFENFFEKDIDIDIY